MTNLLKAMYFLLRATLLYLGTIVIYSLVIGNAVSLESSPDAIVNSKFYVFSTILAPLIASAIFGLAMINFKFTPKAAFFVFCLPILITYIEQYFLHNGLFFGNQWDVIFLLCAGAVSLLTFWGGHKLKDAH
jgi:hypothetical protein